MPAYLIAQVEVHDAKTYQLYTAKSPGIIASHGGRILARGGETETLEGVPRSRRIVIVEFPSMEAARSFYYSPEYRDAKKIREPVSDAEFVIVEGIE